ncbi:MAG: hypothetical protein GY723_17540 [bacterium]|nr:hypothetical protein [bacterium]MCP5071231.1 hypothetical protein [bacterium]
MPSHLRNRVQSAAVAGALLGIAHAMWPDPGERSVWVYRCITTFGYGHLIGAAWFARQRMAQLRPRDIPVPLWRIFIITSIGTLLGTYAWLLHLAPGLILFFFGVSAWHVAENDLALGQAYRDEGRLPDLIRSPTGHAGALAATSVVVLAGLLTPELGWTVRLGLTWTGPSLSDVFAAVTGYHLVSWVRFMIDRIRWIRWIDADSPGRMYRALLAVHALPLAISLALLGSGDRVATAETLVFGPGLYLFWSVLHVLQTAISRTQHPTGREDLFSPSHSSPITETQS